MPVAGFQVWNADGTLQFDTTNRLFRTWIEVESGTSDGSSATVPSGLGIVVVTVIEKVRGVPPNVSVSGNTVSWNFSDVPVGERANSRIMVEVY